jgi:hypothetical protein
VCAALDVGFAQPYFVRKALVGKIAADARDDCKPCHTQLVSKLVGALEHLPANKRRSAANTIIQLSRGIDTLEYVRIVRWLLASSDANLRIQGYREAREMNTAEALDWVIDSWDRYVDERAARMMIDRCADEPLTRRFARLRDSLRSNRYLLSRPYIRLKHRNGESLLELKQLNPISYVYTGVKLRVPVSGAELREIFVTNMLDGDSGLLLWCFGQLGERDLLLELLPVIETPPRAAIEAYFAKMGIALPLP